MLSWKCLAQAQILKSALIWNLTLYLPTFKTVYCIFSPSKKTKKLPVKYNSHAWAKTKVRTPDGHFTEKINFQYHKKKTDTRPHERNSQSSCSVLLKKFKRCSDIVLRRCSDWAEHKKTLCRCSCPVILGLKWEVYICFHIRDSCSTVLANQSQALVIIWQTSDGWANLQNK